MTKVLFGAFIIAASLCACADNEPDKDVSIVPATDSSKAIVPVVAVPASATQVLPGNTVNATPVTMPNPTATAQPAITAAGMNPAHGQPNHRCDIAVGAPLNSPATKPAATTQTITPTAISPSAIPGAAKPTMSMTPAAQPVKTAPGMNPPHGQPNHRCDIAVGAPLNSPATKPAATTQTITPTAITPTAATPAPIKLEAVPPPAKKDSN